MKNLLAFFGLLCISNTAISQMELRFKVCETSDDFHFHPVENVLITAVSTEIFFPDNRTNSEGEYYSNISNTQIFEETFEFQHPSYSFPSRKLKEFPYRIDRDTITFVITGTPTPRPAMYTIEVPAAVKSKNAKTKVTLRYLATNHYDSVILLDNKNKYLGSYQFDDKTKIHVAKNIDINDVKWGAKIVNITDRDTISFHFLEWMYVLPQFQPEPISRAHSEMKLLSSMLALKRDLEISHYRETYTLKHRISKLEDSIEYLLRFQGNTRIKSDSLSDSGIYGAIYEIGLIEPQHVVLPDTIATQIQSIVQNSIPKKLGSIIYELKIDEQGNPTVLLLSHSQDFKTLQAEIEAFLKTVKIPPYMALDKAYESTIILKVAIQPV